MFSQSKDDVKLEWMYKGPNSTVDREEYLLGRPIDKTLEKLNEEEKRKQLGLVHQPKNHVEHECIPPSIRDYKKQQLLAEQVDIQNKLQEDPLIAIKRREEETRRQFLNNPVQLKKLQEALEAQKKLKRKKGKKKSKKSYLDNDSESDLDSKLAEKIKVLQKFPTKLELIKLQNKQETNSQKEKVLDVILMHKFNALKSKLSEEDMQDILAGKVTDSESESDSDDKNSTEEEPVSKRNKMSSKASKKKKRKRKRKASTSEDSSSESKDDDRRRSVFKKPLKINKRHRRSYSESSYSEEEANKKDHYKKSNTERLKHSKQLKDCKAEKDSWDDLQKVNFLNSKLEDYRKRKDRRKRSKSLERTIENERNKDRNIEKTKDKSRYKNDYETLEGNEIKASKRVYETISKETSSSEEMEQHKRSRTKSFERKRSKESDRGRHRSTSTETHEYKEKHSNDKGESKKLSHRRKNIPQNPEKIKKYSSSSSTEYSRATFSKKVASSESDSEIDTQRNKYNYGLVNADGKKIALQKPSRETLPSSSKKSAHKNQNSMKPSQKSKCKELSREEREKRIKEMMANAAWRDKEREEMLKKHRENEAKETKLIKEYNPEFIHKELLKSADSSSIESRIKANVNNIQRSSGDMSSNFSKRY